jgi:hypothetical protein
MNVNQICTICRHTILIDERRVGFPTGKIAHVRCAQEIPHSDLTELILPGHRVATRCPVCHKQINEDKDRYFGIDDQIYHRDCLREAVNRMNEEFPDDA